MRGASAATDITTYRRHRTQTQTITARSCRAAAQSAASEALVVSRRPLENDRPDINRQAEKLQAAGLAPHRIMLIPLIRQPTASTGNNLKNAFHPAAIVEQR